MSEKWARRFERCCLVIALVAQVLVWLGARAREGDLLHDTAGVFAYLTFACLAFLYVRLLGLKARVAQLEAKSGQKPADPLAGEPAAGPIVGAEDDHLRKLHISRLE